MRSAEGGFETLKARAIAFLCSRFGIEISVIGVLIVVGIFAVQSTAVKAYLTPEQAAEEAFDACVDQYGGPEKSGNEMKGFLIWNCMMNKGFCRVTHHNYARAYAPREKVAHSIYEIWHGERECID